MSPQIALARAALPLLVALASPGCAARRAPASYQDTTALAHEGPLSPEECARRCPACAQAATQSDVPAAAMAGPPAPRVIIPAPPPASPAPRVIIPAPPPAGGGDLVRAPTAGTLAAAPSEPPPDAPTLDPSQPMPQRSVTTNAALTLDRPASVMLDARSDIYSASLPVAEPQRGGVLPSIVTLAPGGGHIELSGARGLIGCEYSSHWGPDGGSCAGGHTRLTAADAVSGIVAAERTLFVTGVFLSDRPGPVPEALDFSQSAQRMSFKSLAPKLGQSFFVGDGLAGTGSGATQHFLIPQGATKLYLGFADGSAFQGTPGWYADNTGSVAFQITQRRP